MNNRIIIIILSAVIVLLVGFGMFRENRMRNFYGPGCDRDNARQHDRMMEFGPGMGHRFCTPDFMKETLNLDDGQIGKINILNETFEKEYGKLTDAIAPDREKLRVLLKQDDPDMKEVRRILEKIGKVNVEIQLLRIKQGRAISLILTPEQMDKLRHERRMFHDRKGPGPGGME